VGSEPVDYTALERGYEQAKMGGIEPDTAYMSLRTFYYLHWYFGELPKLPRKLKKRYIGTRRSRRRNTLKSIRWQQKQPLIVNITFHKEDIEVRNPQ
jgi:hypothetical protein